MKKTYNQSLLFLGIIDNQFCYQFDISTGGINAGDRIHQVLIRIATNISLSAFTQTGALLDYSISKTIDNVHYEVVDITKALIDSFSDTVTVIIKTPSQLPVFTSTIEIEYITPFEKSRYQSYLDYEIGKELSLSINKASSFFTVRKSLFNGLCNLIYDSYYPDEHLLFFPKGWKIDYLEQIIIDSNNLVLVDENYHRRTFKQTSMTNRYLDQSGSSYFIDKIIDGQSFYYRLFSPLLSSYKEYNSDGLLTKTVNENSGETIISYTSSSITIIESNNNQITITKSGLSISITHSAINKTYTLSLNSGSNTLSNLYFPISLTSGDTPVIANEYFSYDNYHLINAICFDNNRLEITYSTSNQKVESITHKSTSSVIISSDSYSYEVGKTTITNEKSISITYYFDEKNKTSRTIHSDDDFNKKTSNDQNLIFDPRGQSETPFQHIYLDQNNQLIYGDPSVDGSNNNSGVRKTFKLMQDIPTIESNKTYIVGVRTHQHSVIPLSTISRKIRMNIYESNENPNNIISIINNQSINPAQVNTILSNRGFNSEYSYFFYIVSPSFIIPSTYGNRLYISFDIPSNVDEFLIKDVSLYVVDSSNVYVVRDERESILLPSSTITSTSITNGTYFDTLRIVSYSDNFLHKNDIILNQLLAFKNNGSTSIFYTDDLTNAIFNQNNIQVYYDYPSTSDFFVNEDIAFVNSKMEINVLSSNNPSSFKITTNIIRGENVYSKYVILDYHGNIIEECDYKGVKTLNTYNPSFDLLTSALFNDNNQPSIQKTYSYDSIHRLTSITSKVGENDSVTKSYTYISSLDLISTETDECNKTSTYDYLPNYEYQTRISMSYSKAISNYDSSLLVSSVSDNNHQYHYDYDNKNNVSSIFYLGPYNPNYDVYIDPNNNTYSKYRLVSVVRSIGSNYQTSVAYSYLNSSSMNETYDKYERLIYKSNSGNPNYCATFAYTSNKIDGKLQTINDYYISSNASIAYDYNDFNQVSGVASTFDGGTLSVSYVYHEKYHYLLGKIESFDNSVYNIANYTILSYQYINDEATNEVTGVTLTYSSRKKLFLNTYLPYIIYIVENKTLDHLNRLSTLNIVLSDLTIIGYEFSYHTSTNITSNQISRISNVHNTDYIDYSYYENGNIHSIIPNGNNNQKVEYFYDNKNQLTREKLHGLDRSITYTYDSYGNIVNVNIQTLSNQLIESINYSYSSSYPNLLSSFRGATITYDEMNNPLSFNGATLTYVRVNMLSSYVKGNKSASYQYNYEGIRTKKIVNDSSTSTSFTHHYVLEGHRICREIIIDNNSSSHHQLSFLYGIDGIIGFVYDHDLYLYEKDIFGNISKIYQKISSGISLVAKYLYDAYGNTYVLNPDGTYNSNSSFIGNINPFRYRSYYYDIESGFYYCNHRYYVPDMRRWLTMDDLSYLDPSKINGINLYAYCCNNPVMNVDPEGYFLGLLFPLFGAILTLVYPTFIPDALLLIPVSSLFETCLVIKDALFGTELDFDVYYNETTQSYNYKITQGNNMISSFSRLIYSIAYLSIILSDSRYNYEGNFLQFYFEWKIHRISYWLGFKRDNADPVDIGQSIYKDSSEYHDLMIFLYFLYILL